ncbi:MAG TPA: DNA polymerase III subunit beta [Anaerolineae bacterium]
MKVSCLQENLAHGLAVVGRAVATRSTLPVLGNILLSTENGRLKLAATNLELAITCWIGAKVDEEGATTVPARLITDFVNSLPNERIDMDLTVRTQSLHLKCARSDANIKGLDASEFPLIPSLSDHQKISIEPDILREMIEQCVVSAATDDSRPVLTGVLAKFEKDAVTFAAADGFRLSVRRATFASDLKEPITAVIPARALSEVARIIGTQEEPVELAITDQRSQVLFHLLNVELVSSLIDGDFPDVARIIPKSFQTRTVVGTGDLQRAVKTASVFARDASNVVRLNISPANEMGGGRVVVAATSAETGDNVDELEATVNGDPIEIAFNARFLSDVLNVMHAPQVSIETGTAASPGVLKPVGRDDFTHVIMPMHFTK